MMSGLSLRAATVRPHPNYLLRQFLLHSQAPSPFLLISNSSRSQHRSLHWMFHKMIQRMTFGWLSMSYPEDAVMSKYCCGAPSFPSEQ
ncbi:hypothetical protein F8388_026114 [Cannabis sativa]|uniref:Uncharacterized protein n=1 Tax=Cannabis sativa TaxID=3483 RepID=A0A7J6G099_CANSA|nr:hypothetical protein G4B88_008399 [Cannabis sativa]KAF4376314.1 hypothetical protein F8388_026114 [Cannabis sativa]